MEKTSLYTVSGVQNSLCTATMSLELPHFANCSEKQVSVMIFFENPTIAQCNADAPLRSSNASLLGAFISWRKAKLTFSQKRGDGRVLPYVMNAAFAGFVQLLPQQKGIE